MLESAWRGDSRRQDFKRAWLSFALKPFRHGAEATGRSRLLLHYERRDEGQSIQGIDKLGVVVFYGLYAF